MKLPKIVEDNKFLFAVGATVIIGGVLYALHNNSKNSDSQYANIDGLEGIPTKWYSQMQLNQMNCTKLQALGSSLASMAYSGSYAPFTAAQVAHMMSMVVAALKAKGCGYLASFNEIASGVWIVKGGGSGTTPKPGGPPSPGTTPKPSMPHVGGTPPLVVTNPVTGTPKSSGPVPTGSTPKPNGYLDGGTQIAPAKNIMQSTGHASLW